MRISSHSRRFIFGLIIVFSLMLPLAAQTTAESPSVDNAAPAATGESPLAGIDFTRCPTDGYMQKIAERVVNREYYSKRPDPRARALAPLSEEEKGRVLALIPRLGDAEWEARAGAQRELETYSPRVVPLLRELLKDQKDPEIRFRLLSTIEQSDYDLLQKKPGELFSLARRYYWQYPPDCVGAFRFYWLTAQKDPCFANDTTVRSEVQNCYYCVEEQFPPNTLDDAALYMLVEFDELAKRFPDSPFIEDVLFRLGEYEALDRLFPDGKYASYVMYSKIAGHWYFETSRGLRFDDLKREIEQWPKFIAKYPGHPGVNDAWYRLGRALEEDGRRLEAIRALRNARDFKEKARTDLPRYDQMPNDTLHMQSQARMRICFIMDALMSAEELDDAQKESSDDVEIVLECIFTRALRHLRAGELEKARAAFADVASHSAASAENKPPVVQKIINCAIKRVAWLDKEVLSRWYAYAAAPDAPGADEHLHKVGCAVFADADCCDNELYGARAYLRTWAVSVKTDRYWRDCDNYVLAAQVFRAMLEKYPDSKIRDEALYMLAQACWTAAFYCAGPHEKQAESGFRVKLMEESLRCYERLISECPGSSHLEGARDAREGVKARLAEVRAGKP